MSVFIFVVWILKTCHILYFCWFSYDICHCLWMTKARWLEISWNFACEVLFISALPFLRGLGTGLTYSIKHKSPASEWAEAVACPSSELTVVEHSTPAVTEHMTSLSQNWLWPSLLYLFNYAVVIFFLPSLNFISQMLKTLLLIRNDNGGWYYFNALESFWL